MIPLAVRKNYFGYTLDPLPSPVELNRLYDRGSFYLDLKPGYFDERAKDSFWWDRTYEFACRFLDLPLESVRSALDFGCGPGYFARFLKERIHGGAVGYDPAKPARVYAREVNGISTLPTLEDCISCGPYDLIVCWEVLEHLAAPEATAVLLRDLLSETGRLLVVVPNEFNPLQLRLADLYGNYWLDRTHLHYFDHRGIRRLFEEADLEVIDQIATFPMELFALLGLPYIGNSEIGKRCHEYRKRFESWISPVELEELYRLFLGLGWGRESLIIGRRKRASEKSKGESK